MTNTTPAAPEIAKCRKCGGFALQSLSQDGKRYSVHCYNEFSSETFDCDAPEGPACPTSSESIARWNEMQTAQSGYCPPGKCNGNPGVRCVLSEFVVDRVREPAPLQLTPPPGTPDSPRKISVYQLTDEEWWAGETLQSCIDAAIECWGVDKDEQADMFDQASEMSEEAMDRLMFCYDADDWSKKHSFRTELDMQIADPCTKFPKFFASTEW